MIKLLNKLNISSILNMPVTFVTAFLDLNNIENRPNHKNTLFYIKKGIELLSFPHSFVVFIDKIIWINPRQV